MRGGCAFQHVHSTFQHALALRHAGSNASAGHASFRREPDMGRGRHQGRLGPRTIYRTRRRVLMELATSAQRRGLSRLTGPVCHNRPCPRSLPEGQGLQLAIR